MNLRVLKILFFVSAVLISLTLFLAFLTAPLVGSIYLWMVHSAESAMSELTSQFSLPMLRVDPSLPNRWPVNFGWVSAVWCAMIAAPILIMIWSLCTSTVEDCLARWSGGMMVYLPLILSLFITVMAGLLVTVAPFPYVVIP